MPKSYKSPLRRCSAGKMHANRGYAIQVPKLTQICCAVTDLTVSAEWVFGRPLDCRFKGWGPAPFLFSVYLHPIDNRLKMILDPLTTCIERLQARIKTHGTSLSQNETRTRMALIDPLLRVLGWDVSDLDCVTPEYQINKKYVDYALLGPRGKPAAILEAKKLGDPLSNDHREQMLTCAMMEGIAYAGLSNGDQWELYSVFEQKPLPDKIILDVSIGSDPVHQSALRLLCLWCPNIRSGQVVRAKDPDPKPPPDDPPNGPEWISLGNFPSPTGQPCPASLRLWDGSVRSLNYWKEILFEIVGQLYADRLLSEADLPLQSTTKSRRFLVNAEPIHRNGSPFTSPMQFRGTPLYVEVNHSSARHP